MLREDLQQKLKEAMKARDSLRLEALRYLWSEVRNAEIDSRVELDDGAIHAIVKREVKKRREGIEQLGKMGRDEEVGHEEAKVAVLEEFLMEELSGEEIGKMVDQVIDSGVSDFGGVMKEVMGLAQGKADGKRVSEVVREKLS